MRALRKGSKEYKRMVKRKILKEVFRKKAMRKIERRKIIEAVGRKIDGDL